MKRTKLIVIAVVGMFGLACFVAVGAFESPPSLEWFWSGLQATPAWMFALAALFLPLFGFPLSVLFVAAAMRFGTVIACTLLVTVIPLHLMMARVLTHKALRRIFFAICRRDIVFFPSIVAKRPAFWAFVLSAAPGIPYMVKNYILALSPLSGRYFYWVAWPVHVIQAIPYLFLGEAVRTSNWCFFWSGLAVFMLLLVVLDVIRRRRESVLRGMCRQVVSVADSKKSDLKS